MTRRARKRFWYATAHRATDRRRSEQLTALVDAGFGGQLLPGGDTTAPGTPGLPHLLRSCLEQTLGKQALDGILMGDAARAFAWRTPSGPSEG
ncbi:hypothetical protein ABZ826_36525 [Streptomyces sp. NPDC047515]|uniref:hypothetical protein n=1 Tax=Streptomyces sp. NPDC047515 TaxID=3155380 RepID=UPI0033CD55A1